MTLNTRIHHSVTGAQQARQTMRALAMPKVKRRRLLQQIGHKVRTATRKRLRSQTDLNGQSWTPRKKREAKKMLRGIGKTLRIRPDEYTVSIGPTNPVASRIASAQQHGTDEVMTARRMQAIHRKSDDQPATKRQAKALQAAGFKVKQPGSEPGKGWRRATQKWITSNLTRARAGLILRELTGGSSKKAWVIPLAPRSFLGATEQDINDIHNIIYTGTRA